MRFGEWQRYRQERPRLRAFWKALPSLALCTGLFCAGPLFPCPAFGQEPPADFEKTSLTLRTALHYDPSVEVPLQKLLELYRNAGRSEDLLALYSSHVAQYPADPGAKLVLARLYAEVKDRKAGEFLRSAVAQHPDNALLTWQLGRWLRDERDPKAVEAMAKAVSLEKSAGRRALWFGELMKAAAVQGREDLVLEETRRLIEEGAMTPEQQLRWSRQALGEKLLKTATRLMEGVKPESLGTDNQVDATMLKAELLSASGSQEEAGRTLDALLAKLAPDYWRRREILMLRLDLTASEGRDNLVEEARKRWQAKEGKTAIHALTLADILEAAHRGREALVVLREAMEVLAAAPQVELRLLDLWEKEGANDEAVQWLEKVIAKAPERKDLQLRRVRWLFASNQGEKAHVAFKTLLTELAPVDQVGRSVELSRWLRRRNQLPDAALLLEAALTRAPERWDLRRELGELYFAQRRTDEIARLFQGDWTRDLAPDARLEITQFLISKQLWVDAKQLLEPWLKAQPQAFEGHLLMAQIEGKLGDDVRVDAVLETARALCDTDTRYQAWLESLMAHAEAREMVDLAVQKEAARLAPNGKVPEDQMQFDRWLALIGQATSRKAASAAEELLKQALAVPGSTPERSTVLERLRLELLGSDPARSLETETGLRKLMEQDALHREDYRLKLVMLYQQAGRQDLAIELLRKLDAAKVTDPIPLKSVIPVCLERGEQDLAIACAEALTRLEPGEMANWSTWTNLLAQSNQEERLRVAIREIVAKANDWKLSDDVRESLQAHLVASQWRSVMGSLDPNNRATLATARREAASMEKLDLTVEQRRWMDWLVAYLSAQMGDTKAAADAFAAFGKLDDKQWISFPDGMELSVAGARESLQDPGASMKASVPAASVSNCLPPFTMAWGFEVEEGALVTRVISHAGVGLAYVCDDRLNVYAVDLKTGKLRWRTTPDVGASFLRGPGPAAMQRRIASAATRSVMLRNQGQPEVRLPLEMALQGSRLCLLNNERVTCLDAATGELIWCNQLADEEGSSPYGPAESRITADASHVLVWQPSVSTVSSLNPATGKLLWQSVVPSPPVPAPNPYNSWGGYDAYFKLKSGISMEGGKVLVYGQTAALLKVENGQVLWRLSTSEVPGFPIDLHRQEESGSSWQGGASAAIPRQLVMYRGSLTLTGNNTYTTGGSYMRRSGVSNAMAGWGYATGLRAILQGQGYYSPYAVLDQGKVWAVSSNRPGLVSAMGLPLGQISSSGMVVGVGGGSLVSFNGSGFTGSSLGRPGQSLLITSPAPASPDSQPEHGLEISGTVSGGRVYASFGQRLQSVDLRSGSRLFDVPLPPDVGAWRKELEKEKASALPAAPPTNRYGRGGMRTMMINGGVPQNQRRNYLPVGVLYQNDRGGGTLCANTAVVDGSYWIIPMNERALYCLRGTSLTTPAPATASTATPLPSAPSSPAP